MFSLKSWFMVRDICSSGLRWKHSEYVAMKVLFIRLFILNSDSFCVASFSRLSLIFFLRTTSPVPLNFLYFKFIYFSGPWEHQLCFILIVFYVVSQKAEILFFFLKWLMQSSRHQEKILNVFKTLIPRCP